MKKTALIYDKWLSGLGGGEVVACTLATILRDEGYAVTILSSEIVTPNKIKEKLSIDLTDIKLSADTKLLSLHPDLFVNISFMDYTYGIGKRNIYYVHFPSIIRTGLFDNVLHFFEKTKLHRYFPVALRERVDDRLRAGVFPDMRKRLNSYDTFICHSKYVQGWIQAMWDKEAVVVYPPVNLIQATNPPAKKNWIASVGRFFTLGHGKKQEVLIEAFKKLYDNLSAISDQRLATSIQYSKNQPPIASRQPPTSNLQLHLIGGVGKEPSSLRYVEQLKALASGYPIYFHFKAERAEVESILLQSKIYWHAGGYGETEPINFEHFGIAPVEAISAGCVPVLFDGGGLSEIIEVLGLNKDKHLFHSIPELYTQTMKILEEQSQLNISKLSIFSSSTFKKNALKVLAQKKPSE